jgi:hypothetical protein
LVNTAVLDCGATDHMSGRREIFSELCPIAAEDVGGISGKASATGAGTIRVQLANGTRVQLQDALYVPGMTATLVSSARPFTTNGYTTVSGAKGLIVDRQHRMVASATCQLNGLYKVDGQIVRCTPPPACAVALGRLLPLQPPASCCYPEPRSLWRSHRPGVAPFRCQQV